MMLALAKGREQGQDTVVQSPERHLDSKNSLRQEPREACYTIIVC